MPARYSAAGVAGIARNDVEITDFGISVRHLDRLFGGLLLATSPRLDWATLLRRTYAVDVLACVRCGSAIAPALCDPCAAARSNLLYIFPFYSFIEDARR